MVLEAFHLLHQGAHDHNQLLYQHYFQDKILEDYFTKERYSAVLIVCLLKYFLQLQCTAKMFPPYLLDPIKFAKY
jgi:hypothetical protein